MTLYTSCLSDNTRIDLIHTSPRARLMFFQPEREPSPAYPCLEMDINFFGEVNKRVPGSPSCNPTQDPHVLEMNSIAIESFFRV
jgi:hypothetical protein